MQNSHISLMDHTHFGPGVVICDCNGVGRKGQSHPDLYSNLGHQWINGNHDYLTKEVQVSLLLSSCV